MTPLGETSDPAAFEVVRALRDAVHARAAVLRRDPAWKPEARPHVHIEFPSFQYGEGGIGNHEFRQSPVLRDLWLGEPLERAIDGVRPAIEQAAAALSFLNPDPFTVRRAVAALAEWLMLDALEGNAAGDDELERRSIWLFRSLRGLPVAA